MKTQPMDHQRTGCARLEANPAAFALGAEQGTGKTWMLLADAERAYEAGDIDGLFVLAPKGVHYNWAHREAPKHLEAPVDCRVWSAGLGVRARRDMAAFTQANYVPQGLAMLTMNFDAVNSKPGLECAQAFLRRYRCTFVIDESHHVKNLTSKRSAKIVKTLGPQAAVKRISSGTLVADKPLDLYGQYEFLERGFLGKSYVAFASKFAELCGVGSGLLRDMVLRQYRHSTLRGLTGKELQGAISRIILSGRAPVVVNRDVTGRPIYRNLEELGSLIAPVTYRVLKKDCLDLPEKIFTTMPYDLPAAHRKLYEQVKAEARYERLDGLIDDYESMNIVTKLRQLTTGFINVEGEAEEPKEVSEAAFDARLDALWRTIEDGEGPMVIWATFREEIRRIRELLIERGCRHVEYHGGNVGEREGNIDLFQNGEADFFLATQAAGGTGITLTAAERVCYFSSSHKLVERTQSEDRTHRIGTVKPVVYTDLVARGTIDEVIADVLQQKAQDAERVMNMLD